MKQEIIIKIEEGKLKFEQTGFSDIDLVGALELIKMEIINKMLATIKK